MTMVFPEGFGILSQRPVCGLGPISPLFSQTKQQVFSLAPNSSETIHAVLDQRHGSPGLFPPLQHSRRLLTIDSIYSIVNKLGLLFSSVQFIRRTMIPASLMKLSLNWHFLFKDHSRGRTISWCYSRERTIFRHHFGERGQRW